MSTRRFNDPPGTYRFTSDQPEHNREQVDRLIDQLQRTFIGRVFAVSLQVGSRSAQMSISLASTDPGRPNYNIGTVTVDANKAVAGSKIVAPVRAAISELMDRER